MKTLLLLLLCGLTICDALSVAQILQYDWKAYSCECKLSPLRHFESSAADTGTRQKQRPTRASEVYVKTARPQKEPLGADMHRIAVDGNVLEVSPTGTIFSLPAEDGRFAINDNSIATLRESALRVNESANLVVEGFSRLMSIHSRLLLSTLSQVRIEEHSVSNQDFASVYVGETSAVNIEGFSRSELQANTLLPFETPTLTMEWGAELRLIDNSQLVVEQGYLWIGAAAYLDILDRSKVSLGRYQYSITGTAEKKELPLSRFVLQESAGVKLTKGSHIHMSEGCSLFVAAQASLNLDRSTILILPRPGTRLVCLVAQPISMQEEHVTITSPSSDNSPDRNTAGVACAKSGDDLANKILEMESVTDVPGLQLSILAELDRDVMFHPLHVDPLMPITSAMRDCDAEK